MNQPNFPLHSCSVLGTGLCTPHTFRIIVDRSICLKFLPEFQILFHQEFLEFLAHLQQFGDQFGTKRLKIFTTNIIDRNEARPLSVCSTQLSPNICDAYGQNTVGIIARRERFESRINADWFIPFLLPKLEKKMRGGPNHQPLSQHPKMARYQRYQSFFVSNSKVTERELWKILGTPILGDSSDKSENVKKTGLKDVGGVNKFLTITRKRGRNVVWKKYQFQVILAKNSATLDQNSRNLVKIHQNSLETWCAVKIGPRGCYHNRLCLTQSNLFLTLQNQICSQRIKPNSTQQY